MEFGIEPQRSLQNNIKMNKHEELRDRNLKLSGASSGESPIMKEEFSDMIRSLTPQQVTGNALTAGFRIDWQGYNTDDPMTREERVDVSPAGTEGIFIDLESPENDCEKA